MFLRITALLTFSATSLLAADEKLEWINAVAPVSMSDLEGRLVILHFWTYC